MYLSISKKGYPIKFKDKDAKDKGEKSSKIVYYPDGRRILKAIIEQHFKETNSSEYFLDIPFYMTQII